MLEALILCPRVSLSDIPGHRGIADGMLDPAALFDPASEPSICAALEAAESPRPPQRELPISTPSGRAAARRQWVERFVGLVSGLRRHRPPAA